MLSFSYGSRVVSTVQCSAGVCQATAVVDCDDSNPCTDDSCDSSLGCVNVANDTNVCGVSDPCLTSPKCVSGSCEGEAVNCTAQGFVPNQCQDSVCESGVGCKLVNVSGRSCVLEDQCVLNPTVSRPKLGAPEC